MKFNIKTNVVLSKEFAVEAESLKDDGRWLMADG